MSVTAKGAAGNRSVPKREVGSVDLEKKVRELTLRVLILEERVEEQDKRIMAIGALLRYNPT